MSEVSTKKLTMDNILGIRFDFGKTEESELQPLGVGFKKVVNTAQYETETFDSNATVYVPRSLNGIALILVNSIVESQLEYGVLCKLFLRGSLTDAEFAKSRSKIEDFVSSLYLKAIILNTPIEFIKDVN